MLHEFHQAQLAAVGATRAVTDLDAQGRQLWQSAPRSNTRNPSGTVPSARADTPIPATGTGSIADAMQSSFAVPSWLIGLVFAVGVGLVPVGGISCSGHVASTLVPVMSVGYVLSALAVLAFTTILGWAYYSERCWEHLLGTRSKLPFRVM